MARRKAVEKADAFTELGATGLKQFSGIIDDDFVPELRSPVQRHKLYREIRDNSAVIGGALLATELLLRRVTITAKAASDSPQDQDRAAFLQENIEQLEQPWGATLSQALTMQEHGWSLLESVYKRRDDGRVGWSKFVIRSQESLDHWEFDDNTGALIAFWQRPAPKYSLIRIPAEKFLLFRLLDNKASPEGRSLLRNCVIAWKFVKRIQSLEAIGIERDLAGLPVVWAPPEVVAATSGQQLTSQQAFKKLVTNIRRDEQEGILMPLAYNQKGEKQYDLTLLTSGGSRQFDTSQIIQRYEQRMLQALLSDFILLGHETVGSFSLSADKTDLHVTAIASLLSTVLEQFNRFAIPRLMKLNGWPPPYPQLQHAEIEKPDLAGLADYVQKLSAAGMLTPDADGATERYLRDAADLPVEEQDSEAVNQ